MPASHIAGVPIEETVLSLGGPAAIYAALVGLVVAFRGVGSRLRGRGRFGAS
jgi:hypothetical protein